MMLGALLLAAAPAGAAALPAPDPAAGCDKPVLMVVAGPTHDRARMLAYGKAIAGSGLYQRLGGYYLNDPRELTRLEGEAPPGYTTLIVRFPCFANAKAFWESSEYQTRIKPLRLNPSAGDYVVSVYPEVALREDILGKVGANDYLVRFDGTGATPRPTYADPPGLVLGVAAAHAPRLPASGGGPASAVLRSDPSTGEALRFTINEASSFDPGRATGDTHLYVTAGIVTVGRDAMSVGDLLRVSQGAPIGRVTGTSGSAFLVFRDPPRAAAEKPQREVVRGGQQAWTVGQVSREAGAPAPLLIKRLWTDPATGAQLHLVKVAPGVGVPWEVHPVAEEGYLLEGDYHLAECLPSGRRDYDYVADGYFYRPAGLLHSGPPSTTRGGATWLIRTPGKLTAVFYPACPVAPAAKETTP